MQLKFNSIAVNFCNVHSPANYPADSLAPSTFSMVEREDQAAQDKYSMNVLLLLCKLTPNLLIFTSLF